MNIKKYYIFQKSNISFASVWIDSGSIFDKKGQKGINQILCSLLTRGCKNYDNYLLSDYINSYGGELNYETFEDGMIISIKSISTYFEKLYPLIDLIIEEPRLSENEFNKCKINLLNGLIKFKENPFNLAYENWRKKVYIKSPYAFDSNGYEEDIKRIKYDDILEEYFKFKRRSKFLLSNFKANNMEDITNKKGRPFQNIKYRSESESNSYNSNRCIFSNLDSNQSIILLGNQTCSYLDKDYLILKILESYLSFGMSSKLFNIFREDNGLTYDVGIYNSPRKLNSPFLIYLSVSPKNASLSLELLLKLWDDLLRINLSQSDLKLAKAKLKGSILNSNQTIEGIISRKCKLIASNKNHNFDEILLKELEKISTSEILKITKKYFSKPILSFVGSKIHFKKLRKIFINKFK